MARQRLLRFVLFVAVGGLLAGACSSSGEEAADAAPDSVAATTSTTAVSPSTPTTVATAADGELVFPAAEWATADAANMGIAQDALADLVAEAEATDSACLMVTRNGRMVREWYWDKEPTDQHQTFSATKSFTSGLVGMASDAGHLAIGDPASDYITEWQGTDSEAVLVEDLLQNDSGRFYDFTTDYVEMATQAADKSAFSIDLDQEFQPSTEWAYNNSAIQALETVLRWPSSPDTFAAMGFGGQFISVDPDAGLAITRQAISDDGTSVGLTNLAGTLVPTD